MSLVLELLILISFFKWVLCIFIRVNFESIKKVFNSINKKVIINIKIDLDGFK